MGSKTPNLRAPPTLILQAVPHKINYLDTSPSLSSELKIRMENETAVKISIQHLHRKFARMNTAP